MEQHSALNDVLEMIEVLIKLEFNMKTVFNTDLHLHLLNLLGLLDVTVIMQYGKIKFLDNGCFHVSVDNHSDEISNSACNPIECFILFFKISELKSEAFGLC